MPRLWPPSVSHHPCRVSTIHWLGCEGMAYSCTSAMHPAVLESSYGWGTKRSGTSRKVLGATVLLLQVHHARPGIHHVRQRRVRRPGLRPRLLRSTPIPAFLAHASGTAGPLHSSATHCAVCDLPFPEARVGAFACGNGQLEGQTPCSTRVGCDETRDRARPLTARLHGCPSWMQVSRRGLSRAASSF